MGSKYAWSWADFEREKRKDEARKKKQAEARKADPEKVTKCEPRKVQTADDVSGCEGRAAEKPLPNVSKGCAAAAEVSASPSDAHETSECPPITPAIDPMQDWLKAKRNSVRGKPVVRGLRPALLPAASREPCDVCGVPGFRGCEHQLPFEAPPSNQPYKDLARSMPSKYRPAKSDAA